MAVRPENAPPVKSTFGLTVREIYTTGHTDVRSLIDGVAGDWADVRVELERIVDGGDSAVVFGTVHGTSDGEPIDVGFAQLWESQDGRPSSERYFLTGENPRIARARSEMAELAEELGEHAAALRAAWAALERERKAPKPAIEQAAQPRPDSWAPMPQRTRRGGLFGRGRRR
jgi:hypothetical protein